MTVLRTGHIAAHPAFHGWRVVAAVHLLLGLSFGSVYAFGAMFTSLQQRYGQDNASTALVFAATALVYHSVGVAAGAWADRVPARWLAQLGVLLLALGFGISSLAPDWPRFALSYSVLVGLGIGVLYVPCVALLPRWFVRRRSSASGFALAGTGVGALLGPWSVSWLLQRMALPAALQLVAGAVLLLGLVAAGFLHREPAELGQWPDGEASEAVQASAVSLLALSPPSRTLREAVAHARFWWFFVAVLLGSIGLMLAAVHLSPLVQRGGLGFQQANLVLGLIGAGYVLGRLLLGRLADRLGALRTSQLLTAALAGLCLMWLGAQEIGSLALFALLFGVANGGCITLYPVLAAEWFGLRHLGAVLGALYVSVGLAALVGGPGLGWLLDRGASPAVPITLAALCAALSVLALERAQRAHLLPGH